MSCIRKTFCSTKSNLVSPLVMQNCFNILLTVIPVDELDLSFFLPILQCK